MGFRLLIFHNGVLIFSLSLHHFGNRPANVTVTKMTIFRCNNVINYVFSMGTRKNCLTDAFLTNSHKLCFRV